MRTIDADALRDKLQSLAYDEWRDKGMCRGYKVTRIGNSADMRGTE